MKTITEKMVDARISSVEIKIGRNVDYVNEFPVVNIKQNIESVNMPPYYKSMHIECSGNDLEKMVSDAELIFKLMQQ